MREMRDLARDTWPTGRWHPGGLAWSLHQHARTDWPIRVWDDHAWGWLPAPGVLEWQVHPDHPDLADEVLDWADTVTTLTDVVAWSDEPHQLDALTRRGYRPVDGPFFIRLAHALDTPPPDPAPPASYRTGHVTDDLVPARVEAHRAAWHPSRVTEHSYRVVRAAEPYRDDLDRIVLTADRTVAAYCLAWLDGGVGEFEPVGTHPDHRRLGLARTASLDALHRLRDLGAHTAIVHARGDDAYPVPFRLYRSVGFTPTGQRTVTYRR
ncbi:GNAT family N-acetyltransferase [Saccharothrix deserti]|uniref:GNAT family N-acetyltransferase n=1 Tax=Saccharothrix deserti TaxID=2593674 RepID=UPI00131DED67|nr:GNAT family N-acetyltransferase [Saccharothrix deserti]